MQKTLARLSKIMLAAHFLATSASFAADDIDLEGRVRLNVESNALKKGSVTYEGKLDVESDRKDGTKGVLGLKARSKDDAHLFVEEAYIDHRLNEGKLIIGQVKKKFGLEYELSEKRRLTIKRSPIYQKIEGFAYVGHEPTVRYEHLPAEPGSLGYATSFGYSGSQEPYAIFYFNPNTEGVQYGSWTLLQGDRLNNATQLVGALMLAIWNHEKPQTYEVEAIVGMDPFQTAWERDSSGRKVVFSGLKATYAPWFALGGEKLNTQFVTQASYIVHDTKTPKHITVQGLMGVSRYINDRFNVSADIEIIAKNSQREVDERNYDDSNIKLQVEYYL